VTSWIFARSLLNAAILGYYFGIAGALAYTAYYGSFLTGWLIVRKLRFYHGADSIQDFIGRRFGRWGNACFNLLVSIRLLSEVFANLLVVGMVFGESGSTAGTAAIIAVAAITLVYSMNGGLFASLRTDVLQMTLVGVLLLTLFLLMIVQPQFDVAAVVASSPDPYSPGWVLLCVALLQIISYPMHDPVMMDRGFLADHDTTRRSFIHAFWISALCIMIFGVLGVYAGLNSMDGEGLLETLYRLLGSPAMTLLALTLVISAASTLDSSFSSAAKLLINDMKLATTSERNGRVAMLFFAVGGLVLVLVGPPDLFAAVAVSGTASLFLAPVVLFSVLGDRDVALWSYLVAFVVATGAAAVYFLETSGHLSLVQSLTGYTHKYDQLLLISLVTLVINMSVFALGLRKPVPVLE
jgi:Na+/proline symporter